MNLTNKPWLLACLLIGLLLPCFGQAREIEEKVDTITVVLDDNYPPFIFRDSNGALKGIIVDEWQLWEKKTGIRVNLDAMDWGKALAFFSKGRADVIDTIFFTEKRAEVYDFTKPYATIAVPIFYHKNLSGIVDIESLHGFTIGVKAGDACIDILTRKGITNLKEYNSYESIVQAAIDGQIKVFCVDKPPALYYLYKMNYENEFRQAFTLYSGQFHRAVKKGRTELLHVVQDGFALIPEREHKKIIEKWMGESLSGPKYLRYVLFSFLVVCLIVLTLVFFNLALRKKIRLKTAELRALVHRLQISEERFKSIFDQAAVGVALCDSINSKYIAVNDRYCEIAGYSQNEIKRLSFLNITHPDDLQHDLDKMKLILEGKIREFTLDKRYIRKDGSIVWVKITVSPIRSNSDDVKLHIAIVEDITEQKRAQAAIRETEEKYRKLAGSLPQVVFETDVNGNLTFVNQNAFDLFGYTEDDLKNGLNALEMIIPEDRERAMENIQKNLDGVSLGGVEYTALRKNGTTFPVIIHSKRSMANNRPIGLNGLIIDLTESKKMERDLRRQAMAMDQSTDVIVITDTQGMIIYVNPAFEMTTGFSRKEAIGRNPKILKSGKQNDLFYHDLWQTISAGKTWHGRFVNKKRDGSEYIEEASISPVFSDTGKIVNYVAVKRDISERLKLEAMLQQSKKMEAIGLLAGGVAHDLNNVLSGIVSYPDLLLQDLPEDSPLRKPIVTIQKSGQKAADIVEDLLTLARRGVRYKDVLNVNDIILDYMNAPEYKKLLSYHPDVVVETDLDRKLMEMEGSTVQVKKILMNLVSNAVEAQPSGGKIVISTQNQYVDRSIRRYEEIQEGEFVVLKVKDSGFGIGAEDLTRIFEPFYTKKKMGRSGTGLGLAVVWGAIHDHDGYIDVESTPNIGTTFSLFFPATRKKRAIKSDAIPFQAYVGDKETILIVDDIKEQRAIARNLLEKLNYSVSAVSSGEEAVKFMEKGSADLLVLDMIMDPGMDGLDTYTEILKLHPEQKAVITSGYSETQRAREAQKLGAGEYVQKPYTLEKIGLAVNKELRK